jgi:hypothetical protein
MNHKQFFILFILLPCLPLSARVHFKVLPIVDYNSDVGVGYGAHTAVTVTSSDSTRELCRLEGEFYATTGGVFEPYLECELPFAGPGRLRVHASYDRILYNQYYGFGNSDNQTGYLASKDLDYSYDYGISFPEFMLLYDFPVGKQLWPWLSTLKLAAGVMMENVSIRKSPKTPGNGSEPLLFEERPLGIDGGFVHEEIAGLILDNRDDRIDPSRGVYCDMYCAGSSRALASAYSYLHATGTLAWYGEPVKKFGRLVLASRLLVDYIRGDAPFFVYEHTAGFDRKELFGGRGSMRGIPQYRYKNRFSFVLTPECRLRVFSFRLFGDDFMLGPALFSDLGNTFASPLLMEPVLQVTYGGGLRLRWANDFVASFDLGFWRNSLSGIYLYFGHQF